MRKFGQLKRRALLTMFSFIVFCSPYLLANDTGIKGNLIGFIYEADKTSPFEKGIVQIRNVSTGTVYESIQSNKFGIFKIGGIERGFYVVSVKTEKGDFRVRNVIGIRTSKTVKVYFSLEIDESNGKPVGHANVLASSEPFIYNALMSIGDHKGGDKDKDKDEPDPSPHKPKKKK